MKKVLFCYIGGEVLDHSIWSGTPYSIYNTIKDRYDVELLNIPYKYSLLAYAIKLIYRPFGISFSHLYTYPFAWKASKCLQRQVEKNHYDLIFVIGCFQISYLKTDTPIVYFSDSVVSNMIGYYINIEKKSIIDMYNKIQKKALDNCDFCVFTSKWAAKAAIIDYQVPKRKISIVHLGANIENNGCNHIAHKEINLLFVGVDLERKGAQIAVDTVVLLNKMDESHKYVLHLVGNYPTFEYNKSCVKCYGFINRNIEVERKKLDNLRAISDIFILPTKAECAGIVFCEASAYGLPSITYDTGGIGDYVIDGVNGYKLPINSGPKEFAEKILYIINDGELLTKMKKQAIDIYENDFNWNIFGKKISKIIDDIGSNK